MFISPVEAHCYNVSEGEHSISLHVNSCPFTDAQGGDTYTGWHSTSQRLIVEEFRDASKVVASKW